MTITVHAVYRDGALQLELPLELRDGSSVRLEITPLETAADPLDEVIGICDEGPDFSLAERHDEILYGLKARTDGGQK